MKLKTLLDFQRCWLLLREAELTQVALTGQQYVDCVKAQSAFDYELRDHIESMPQVEVTGEAA